METPQQSAFELLGASRLLDARGTPLPIAKPSKSQFLEATKGYLYMYHPLYYPAKTAISNTTVRAQIKDFPELSSLEEPEYTTIFNSYPTDELRSIRKQVSKVLKQLEKDNIEELQGHRKTWTDLEIARKNELDAQEQLAQQQATAQDSEENYLDEIVADLALITPVISIGAPVTKGIYTSRIKDRAACPVNRTLQAMTAPVRESYESFVLYDIYFENDFLPWRSKFIAFLDLPSTFLHATQLIDSDFLLRVQAAYGVLVGNPGFQFVNPAWNYRQLLEVLDSIYWPKKDVVDTILADLEAIKMAPVPLIFSRDSLINYKKYYAKIDIYLIKNKDMVATIDEVIIVNQFIANMSFNPTILNLAKKEIKTMADCIVPINKYLKTQTDSLQYQDPSPVVVNNVQVQAKQVEKSEKKGRSGPERTNCWNCEHLKQTDAKPHQYYSKCPFDCRSCKDPTCAGTCAGFQAFVAQIKAARDVARAARGPKKVHTLVGSSHISSIISPIRVL